MKLTVLLSALLFTATSFASETLRLDFTNGAVELTATIETFKNGFSVDIVKLKVPGENHGSLHLVSEVGYGDRSYYYLCEQISILKFGTDQYKYATAYGRATTFGAFSGIFSSNEFLVINLDQSFTITDTHQNSSYDSGFACYDEEMKN